MRRDQDTESREGTEVLGLGDRVLTREPWTGWMWEVRKRLEHLGAVPRMERPGRQTGGGFDDVRFDLFKWRRHVGSRM